MIEIGVNEALKKSLSCISGFQDLHIDKYYLLINQYVTVNLGPQIFQSIIHITN